MKPNSSWSLREKDQAAPKSTSLGGGAHAAGAASTAHEQLVERRIVWFIYRTAEKRASAVEAATGLALEPEASKQMFKAMMRKGILRELAKTPDRPIPQFMVTPKFIPEARTLAAGPDPAEA